MKLTLNKKPYIKSWVRCVVNRREKDYSNLLPLFCPICLGRGVLKLSDHTPALLLQNEEDCLDCFGCAGTAFIAIPLTEFYNAEPISKFSA